MCFCICINSEEHTNSYAHAVVYYVSGGYVTLSIDDPVGHEPI